MVIPTTVEELEDQLSTPTERVVAAMGKLDGDLVVLGAGGKMGPTLARMARRATDEAGVDRRIIAVSRFRDTAARDRLQAWGIETESCDLLDQRAVAKLPDAPNVIFMTGLKFGASSNPGLTWAMNCHVPMLVCQRYRSSRFAVFSSGNVYGMTPVMGSGSVETDIPQPVGEYAITVLGRERMFEYCSHEYNIPVVQLRLNYATELRYGVLVDVARQIANQETVDVTTGCVNVIWQTEANAMALESMLHATSPPRILNIAGPEFLPVRDIALKFGELLGKPVELTGTAATDALLSDGSEGYRLLGSPAVDAEQMMRWTAQWVQRGGEYLDKPTHFESRDGKF